MSDKEFDSELHEYLFKMLFQLIIDEELDLIYRKWTPGNELVGSYDSWINETKEGLE